MEYETIAIEAMNALEQHCQDEGYEIAALIGALNVEHVKRLRSLALKLIAPTVSTPILHIDPWVYDIVVDLYRAGHISKQTAVSMDLYTPKYQSARNRENLVKSGLVSRTRDNENIGPFGGNLFLYYVNKAGIDAIRDTVIGNPLKKDDSNKEAVFESAGNFLRLKIVSVKTSQTQAFSQKCKELSFAKNVKFLPGDGMTIRNEYDMQIMEEVYEYYFQRSSDSLNKQLISQLDDMTLREPESEVAQKSGVDAVDEFFNI